MKNSEQ